jgi:hypothetical protein
MIKALDDQDQSFCESVMTTEEYLDKYILLHCAKLELSLIDVSSG